jgi:hypothetical protein
MPKSDTWRTYGWEGEIGGYVAVSPSMVQITGATPVLYPTSSTGIDLSARPRRSSIVVLIRGVRTGGKETVTITESATTNGTYTAATTSGDLTQLAATGTQYCTVKYNPAKPFLRVTFTGDGAGADWIVSASILYL